jgi:hypothetical protein
VNVARAPRLTGGLAASVLFHGALIAAFFGLRPPAPPAEPPMYSVRLIAAPAGERAAGVVQEAPTPAAPPTPAPATPAPTPAAAVVKQTVAVPKKHAVKPVPHPAAATPPTPAAKAAVKEPAKTKTDAPPIAGGGPVGGKGTDVANVDTPGIEFPYPYYTTNITSQLIRRFGSMAGSLSATVRFVIRRDGTVDPESIAIVEHSGSYPFDQRAYGAVESAANAKAFGPLPPGFREDILPVTFRFSPSVVR